jgi:hypothetical protein
MSDEFSEDSDLPVERRVADFSLRVPPSLTWERVVEISRGLDERIRVQVRGSGWSESVPLVLLEFDHSGLQLTMRRALEGEQLCVHGEADWVDIGACEEAVAEQLCVQILTALCERAGARVVSARFASGTTIR